MAGIAEISPSFHLARSILYIVITGFNTDIEFEGVVYHVQTEDKGLSTPVILSLVYDRGTILASKRAPYEDLLKEEFYEKALAERLQRQHSLICAAVSKGRIEDLKQMSALENGAAADLAARLKKKRSSRGETTAVAELTDNIHDTSRVPENVLHAGLREEIEAAKWESSLDEDVPKPSGDLEPIPIPDLAYVSKASVRFTQDGSLDDEVRIFDDDSILPSEAVEIVSDLAGTPRPANNKLTVEFIGESRFRGGEDKTVSIMVCRGTERKVVGDAEVMVKILGSSFRPLIFHARTDKNGLAIVHMHLPHFQFGRAKMLVRAMSNGEEVELRRVISHG